MDLFDIVKQRPLTERSKDTITCPACGASGIRARGIMSTAVSGPFNHYTEDCKCRCGQWFKRECKEHGVSGEGNVWYCWNDRTKGMPSCFENYKYECTKCGGVVRRKYLGLNDDNEQTALIVSRLDDGTYMRHYRTFYLCDGCGHGGEVPYDYWTPNRK